MPLPTTGLVLDLNAESGIFTDTPGTIPATVDGEAIGRWADQSGTGNSATQSTLANRPILKLNTWNGKDSIRFDGSSDFLDSPTLTLPANTISIYAVASKASGTASYRRIISNENNVYLGHDNTAITQMTTMYGNGGSWVATTGHGTDADLYNNTPYVFASVNNGTDNAYLNSLLIGSRAAAMAAFTDGYRIGAQPGVSAQFWNRDIWRILIYNTVHDAATRQQVLDELHATYGVAIFPTFTREATNPIVDRGTAGAWDDGDVANPDVFYDTPNSRWVMNYSGYDGAAWHTGLAYSTDLVTWTKEPTNPIISPNGVDEGSIAANGSIVLKGGAYYLYYQRSPANDIRCQTSTDLLTWIPQGAVVGLGASGQWDDVAVFDPMARLADDGTTVEMYYAGNDGTVRGIGRATSSDGLTFTKQGLLFSNASLPWSNVNGNLGEPFAFGFRNGGQEFGILFDSATVTDDRYISFAWTLDGGLTWKFRKAILDGAGAGWDSVQVFDSSPLVTNDTLYLFFAGAALTGGGAGMGADIGVASAPWPYDGVTTLAAGGDPSPIAGESATASDGSLAATVGHQLAGTSTTASDATLAASVARPVVGASATESDESLNATTDHPIAGDSATNSDAAAVASVAHRVSGQSATVSDNSADITVGEQPAITLPPLTATVQQTGRLTATVERG